MSETMVWFIAIPIVILCWILIGLAAITLIDVIHDVKKKRKNRNDW